MKQFYKLSLMLRTLLCVWLAILLCLAGASQALRMKRHYMQPIDPQELIAEQEHVDEKSYSFYLESAGDKEGESLYVCIGETRRRISSDQLEALFGMETVTTSIEVLRFSVPSDGLFFGNQSVSYIRYGCLGESGFTEEDVDHYRLLAAEKFTQERCAFFGADNREDIPDAEENVYRKGAVGWKKTIFS